MWYSFFTADFGGNAMMYVNLIWIWGHPTRSTSDHAPALKLPEVEDCHYQRLFKLSSMVAPPW